MADIPVFDPSQPFETLGGGNPPPFDPSKPFEEIGSPSTIGDVAGGLSSGLLKGAAGLAGLPGDVSRGMNWLGDKTQQKLTDWGLLSPQEAQRQQERFQKDFQPERGNPIPGSADVQRGMEKVTGPLYEPQTLPGQYAQTIGEFVPNAIGGPETLVGKAARVAVPAITSETAGQFTKGTAAEPYARFAGALLGEGPRAVRDIKNATTKTPINAPALDELHDAAQQAYKTVRNYGVEIKRQPVARLADDILSDLHNKGFRKLDAPSAFAKIEELKSPAGRYVTIDDLESVRKALGKVNPINGAEKEVGRRAVEAIDKYVSSLDRNAGHIAVNPHFAGQVSDAIKEARGNWAAMKRGETIEGKLNEANRGTQATGSGANINNKIRQQINQVLRSPKLRRGFSDEELGAMRQLVMGTKAGNLARKVGKLSPEGIVSGGLGIELGHLATGNVAHGLVVPILGKIFKIFGDRSTAKQAERISQMVRQRSPLGRTLPQPLPPPAFSERPYVQTGLLGQSSAQEHEPLRFTVHPESVQGHAAGGRAEGGGADSDGDVNLSPDAQALASSMTHYAEQPNPAQPYLDAVKNRLFGADYNPPILGTNTRPEDYGRELLRNPELLDRSIEQAMPFAGMVGSLKTGAGGQGLIRESTPGRTARAKYSEPLPIGTEPQILARAEQRLNEGPSIVSKIQQNAILRTNWAKYGKQLDYDDPGVWEDFIGKWNEAHPERKLDPDKVVVRSGRDPSDPTPAGQKGRRLTTAHDENGGVPGFNDHAEAYDAYLETQRAPYPGAKAANEYFEEDPETMKHTAYTSMRQIPEEYRPPHRQAMKRVPDVSYESVPKGAPANTNLTPTEQFIDEYDALVRKKAAEINREGFRAIPQEPPPPSITAYHGSPHDFDRFDISKIGTGEGAQAYGHGLYFAENEGVARDYRDSIGPKNLEDDHAYALSALNTYRGDRGAAIQKLRESSASIKSQMARRDKPIQSWIDDADRADRAAELLEKGWQPPSGKMYQVSIKADPEHFLDWDKPLSEQSEKVKQALAPWDNPVSRSAGEVYQYARYNPGKFGDVDQKLRSAGIPGIKYLDQQSRGAKRWIAQHPSGGINDFPTEEAARAFVKRNPEYALKSPEDQQSRNFVVFDDKLIDIMKKYGLAGLVAAGAYHYQDKAQAQGRARGGGVVAAHKQSRVGLAQNPSGVPFRCSTCMFIKKGVCQNPDSLLHEKKVKPNWCCKEYDRPDMKVIA